MSRLAEHAPEIAGALLAAARALLALDYDGTLTEIVDDPDEARLTPERRGVLMAVSALPRLHLAVLSGRGLADVTARLGVPAITVVGNHGLELEGWSVPGVERSRPALAAFLEELAGGDGLPFRIRIEDKGATATVHLRGTRAELDRDRLMQLLQERLDRFLAGGVPGAGRRAGTDSEAPLPPGGPILRLHPGKAAVEVRPAVAWDKARALLVLLERWGIRREDAFYAGDDVTDECVFEELAEGVTVKVGEPPTRARYVAAEPAEVYRFLAELLRRAAA